MSLKLDDLAFPAVTLGVAGLMLAKRAVSRGAWKTVLGFGLLFLGMTMMGGELKAVAKEPGFISFFSRNKNKNPPRKVGFCFYLFEF